MAAAAGGDDISARSAIRRSGFSPVLPPRCCSAVGCARSGLLGTKVAPFQAKNASRPRCEKFAPVRRARSESHGSGFGAEPHYKMTKSPLPLQKSGTAYRILGQKTRPQGWLLAGAVQRAPRAGRKAAPKRKSKRAAHLTMRLVHVYQKQHNVQNRVLKCSKTPKIKKGLTRERKSAIMKLYKGRDGKPENGQEYTAV